MTSWSETCRWKCQQFWAQSLQTKLSLWEKFRLLEKKTNSFASYFKAFVISMYSKSLFLDLDADWFPKSASISGSSIPLRRRRSSLSSWLYPDQLPGTTNVVIKCVIFSHLFLILIFFAESFCFIILGFLPFCFSYLFVFDWGMSVKTFISGKLASKHVKYRISYYSVIWMKLLMLM